MTNDDIIKIARSVRDGGHWNQLDIMRFAALVAAAEREECAKVCEAFDNHVAEAIRARGEK